MIDPNVIYAILASCSVMVFTILLVIALGFACWRLSDFLSGWLTTRYYVWAAPCIVVAFLFIALPTLLIGAYVALKVSQHFTSVPVL